MVGFKCNYCEKEIPENEYFQMKSDENLRCERCGKGNYEAYFVDEKDTENFNDDFTEYTNEDDKVTYSEKYEEKYNKGSLTNKIKDVVKKGNDMPGATLPNKIIGAVTGAILGSIILGGFPFIGWLMIIGAGVAGFFFAPYFVPTMRKVFKRIVRWIKDKIDDDDD